MRPIDADKLKANCDIMVGNTTIGRRDYVMLHEIDNAPTIDAVSEWIPCSERMPSEQGEYLVAVTYEGDTYVECLHYGKPTMANREVKGECFYDSDDEWGDIVYDTEAIAWMPLPKPYGEREGE